MAAAGYAHPLRHHEPLADADDLRLGLASRLCPLGRTHPTRQRSGYNSFRNHQRDGLGHSRTAPTFDGQREDAVGHAGPDRLLLLNHHLQKSRGGLL